MDNMSDIQLGRCGRSTYRYSVAVSEFDCDSDVVVGVLVLKLPSGMVVLGPLVDMASDGQ